VLALTNADQLPRDPEDLEVWDWDDIVDAWIRKYAQDYGRWIAKELRTQRGLARYLSDARIVSQLCYERISAKSTDHQRFLDDLDLGLGPPWVVPMSAYGNLAANGKTFEEARAAPESDEVGSPEPVHVELPILLALCHRWNVLA